MKNIKGFTNKLDIEPPEKVEIKYKKPKFNDNEIKDVEDDYIFLREKFRYLMATGEFILDKSINSLNSEPTPRMIEASSQILKNVTEISEKILHMHEKFKKIKIVEKDEDEDFNKNSDKISSSLVDIIDNIKIIEKNKSIKK